jgi:hypothetical protein
MSENGPSEDRLTSEKVTNKRTRRVEEFFRRMGYLDSTCYQRSGYEYLMRLRIIDPRFAGRNRTSRTEEIESLIAELPQELQDDLTMLVLLAPGEERESPANREFERPSPSLLATPSSSKNST